MISDNWYRVVGDVRDSAVAKINGVDSLTGVESVTGRVWRKGQTSADLTAAVLDEAACTVKVNLSPWLETATVGVWSLRLRLTWSEGPMTVSWPAERPATVTVDSTP